jgi:hypothetical protein
MFGASDAIESLPIALRFGCYAIGIPSSFAAIAIPPPHNYHSIPSGQSRHGGSSLRSTISIASTSIAPFAFDRASISAMSSGDSADNGIVSVVENILSTCSRFISNSTHFSIVPAVRRCSVACWRSKNGRPVAESPAPKSPPDRAP